MKRIVSAVLAVFVAAMGAATAQAHGRPLPAGEISMEVVADKRPVLQAIPHKDFWQGSTRIMKSYLEARKGEKFGIVITNRTMERVGVVVAVDGRNIITGKRSDLARNEAMYIVNAYETARYDGWRTNSEEVHRFYFTDEADSYSARTFGDSSAMGVIAMAVYREKEPPRPLLEERQKRSTAPAAPSAGASKSADQSLAQESAGTGFGESQYSPVIEVQFEPERLPARKMLVKYEWRDVLCRKKILSCGREQSNRLWDEGYAPYPPGYQAGPTR